MLNRFLLTVLLFFVASQLHAQLSPLRQDYVHAPRGGMSAPELSDRTSGTSGTGANIDVRSHRIFWRINPDSGIKYIRGSVQTVFQATQPGVTVVSFDLNSALIIDSVNRRSVPLPLSNITRTGNIFSIDLGVSLANNERDTVTVFYRGTPPGVSGAAQGYQLNTTRSSTAGNVINTLSESYEDRDWWPCKHDMQDKIDSIDIAISVPWGKLGSTGSVGQADTFWAVSNGRLVSSPIINDSTRIFNYHSNYPIASYLVSVAVGRYDRYYRQVSVTTPIESAVIPVEYDLLELGANNANAVIAMDRVNNALIEFSKRFGMYPFKNDKHGFYDGLDGAGGMEHQTTSGIATGSIASISTLVHELMHQWFGDNVTFAYWNDLWLAEGFARYGEVLARELVPSIGTAATAYSSRNNLKNTALSYTANSAFIPSANASTSNNIWNSAYGGTVYERGGMIVSMLRTMCGDSVFFSTMTRYQQELAGKSATTDTLRNYFNRALNRDISCFFDDYVGGSGKEIRTNSIGSPINNVNWNNIGTPATTLVVSMRSQTKTAGSNVNYFRGPVQIHVKGALPANDTTITFFDWGNDSLSYAGNGISIPVTGNRLVFDLSFVPTTVLYDDSARLMSVGLGTSPKTGTTKVTTLSNYIWQGTASSDWNDLNNWLPDPGVPPNGAAVTIATIGSFQPILNAGNTSFGTLKINAGNTIKLSSDTITLNHEVRGTGAFIGSVHSDMVIAGNAGDLNFTQTDPGTRSLQSFTMRPKSSVTIGDGLLDIFGALTIPAEAIIRIKSANLLIH